MAKYAVALTFLVATASPALAAEQKPATAILIFCDDQGPEREALDLARGIIKVAFPENQSATMMERLLTGLLEQLTNARDPQADLTPELKALIEGKMKEIPARIMPLISEHLPRMHEASACAYSRMYSIEELRDISGFAHSPSGSHFLSTSTDVLIDPAVAAANEDYLRNLNVLSEEIKNELIHDILKLLNEAKKIET